MAVSLSDPFARESFDPSTGLPDSNLKLNSTEAVVTLLVLTYRLNAPWAALLIICSIVPLLLSVFGLYIQVRSVAPDIFNHVASLTRDNPHVKAPASGSGLDGADRARLLRKMRVQLGDVDAESETGYIASKSVDGGDDCRSARIRRDRLYR